MRLRSRRWRLIFQVVLLLSLGSYWLPRYMYASARSRKIAILTTDTRRPHVDLDPSVLLSSWTLTTLSNYLYAHSKGAQYVYYKIEAPVLGDRPPPVKYQPHLNGYCEHREYGWRTSHFCKMPFVWWFMHTNRNVERFVYIDSDAMFRSPKIHVDRHLDLLTTKRPFGVLTNQPWDDSICSGYWFMYRPMRNLLYDVEDFVLEWWNEDWANTLFQLYDQSTLRRLVGGSPGDDQGGPPRTHTFLNQTVIVDEWSFELKSPKQMILHIGHTIRDRDQQLANAWPWAKEYPLSNRKRLAALLQDEYALLVDEASPYRSPCFYISTIASFLSHSPYESTLLHTGQTIRRDVISLVDSKLWDTRTLAACTKVGSKR